MVKQELVNTSERLDTRRKLYEKATRLGNSFIAVGALIFFFSIIPITPTILKELLFKLFGISLNFGYLWGGSIALGLILIIVGTRVNRGKPIPPKLSLTEEMFLKVFEALSDLDTYFKENIEFSKVEATKKLSKIERGLYEPSTRSGTLWTVLIKDSNEHLRLLKRNLKERLLPTISRSEKEEVKKAYSIVEKFAEYLLNPAASVLEDLNESMSELPPYVEEKAPLIPFLERHPRLRYASLELIFGLIGFAVYYIGIEFLNISTDNAYIAGTALFGTLTAGYMAIVVRKS